MNINNATDLQAAIIELEKRKVIQESLLKEQFHETRESLKPLNMIKSSFAKLTHTPEIRDGVLKTVAGVGIGLLTKNMFLGKAIPLVKSLVGNAVEDSVQKTVKTSADTVKAYGTAIYHNLFRKKAKQ
jgi:hypothetical protein